MRGRALLAVVAISLASSFAATAATYVRVETATLRALDKITGRSTDIKIEVGEPIVFGSLKVEMKGCYQTPPEEAPESAAYLIVEATQAVAVDSMETAASVPDVEDGSDDERLLFSGWMFASSPGLSALEHPVYDIWVIRCTDIVESPADIFDDEDDESVDPDEPLDPDDIFELR